MSPLSGLLNHAVTMTHSDSFLVRSLGSRFTTVIAGTPLEIIAIARNLIKLPFEAAQVVIKVPTKIISTCVDSPTLKEFDTSLPGPFALIKTAFKILGHVIGTFFTATLGLLSPKANFNLHVFLGLITDEKAETQRHKSNQEAAKKREDQVQAMKAHLQNLIQAKKRKIIDNELRLVEEMEMRREAELLASQQTTHEPDASQHSNIYQDIPLQDDEEQKRVAAEEAAAQLATAAAAVKAAEEENSRPGRFW